MVVATRMCPPSPPRISLPRLINLKVRLRIKIEPKMRG